MYLKVSAVQAVRLICENLAFVLHLGKSTMVMNDVIDTTITHDQAECVGSGFDTQYVNYVSVTVELTSILFIIITSSNHRLESAGLNALEELSFRCWQ